MPQVVIELAILVFEWEKTFCALYRAATLIGLINCYKLKSFIYVRH
jgi:hypothetical protein